MALESIFKRKTRKKIEAMFPGCIILKNDAGYVQGIPDMLILFNNRWAMLEFKKEEDAKKQVNQDYYIDLLNRMSYASFIDPENEEQILNELQHALKPERITRFSRR